MRTAQWRIALATFLAVLTAGCSDGPKLAPVNGKLTMNGKALKNVRVDFHPDPDLKTTGPGSSGVTDGDGNFTLVCSQGNKPGAVIGHHRVILTDLDTYGNVLTNDEATQITLAIKSGTGTTGAALSCTANPITVVHGVAA